MRRTKRGLGILAAVGVVSGVGLFAQSAQDFSQSPFLRIDPDRVVIADSKGQRPCGECHTLEWEVWKETKHAKIFDELHRKESAQEILKAMDLRTTKRGEALCMRCHYTVGPERKAIAGVSCESCHGPARDWIGVHNRWGGGAATRAQESPAAREKRIADSRAAGMLRPSVDIYGVTANCFECHTVPREDLVNQGGHSTGTMDFNLVNRVDTIRHNFLHAKQASDNRPLSAERKRVMFVMGRILAYEYSLRGLAEATAEGRYASAMLRRAKDAVSQLEEVSGVASIPVVTEVLKAGGKARLVPNNRTELLAAAQQIRTLGQRFTTTETGAQLASIDPLMSGESTGVPGGDTVTIAPPADSPSTPPPGPAATSPLVSGSRPASGTSQPVAQPPAARSQLPGQIRSRPAWWNNTNRSGMVGAGKCASCHSEAEEWWFNDKHNAAGKRIFGENAKSRQIADSYGIGVAGMRKADGICLSCHATVDEGSKVVRERGVSCESCHGAGKSYLDPHQEGGNPQQGMVALKKPADRAQTCAGCHRISDERLLAAGHPSGANYQAAAASNKIKHWPGKKNDRARQKRGESYPAIADGALNSAYTAAVAGRPVPKVAAVAPARGGGSAPAPSSGTDAPRPSGTPSASEESPRVARSSSTGVSAVPPAVPRYVPAASGPVPLDLEPLPADPSKLTIEELLLVLKRRIESIYTATSRTN